LPQQRVVGAGVGRISRHRRAEPGQKVFEIAYVIVDLRREQPGFVERAEPTRLVVTPLIPETEPDEAGEWITVGGPVPAVAIECCEAASA
jgi:hypothetical protein